MKEKKLRPGDRCPRCHRPAPRLDGVPCKLCCPEGPERLTVTDRKTGVVHWYRSRCKPEVLLGGLDVNELNVGDSTPVTCIDCIAREDEQWKVETIKMVASEC